MECSECGMDVTPGDREGVKAHARLHRLLVEASAAGIEVEAHWAKREALATAAAEKLEKAGSDADKLAAMEERCRIAWQSSMAAAIGEDTWREHPDLAAWTGGYDGFDGDAALAKIWRAAHPSVPVAGLAKGWWMAPPPPPPPVERSSTGRLGSSGHGLRYKPAPTPSAQPEQGGLDDLLGAEAPSEG
ncbi:MAG: hypothetical protein H6738_23980 [Alphaproteobacteria bacterium]|nr:hypothetical protein [Alphaproteobacteria bacterium]MCB9699868.1 hypothetical protein [Alphaproteobacteria bacterium]